MTYFISMKAALQLDETIYPQVMAEGKIVRFTVINVLALGLIHALFSLGFSGLLWSAEVPLTGKVIFAGAGIGVAFLMHAGASLFLWVFTRGAGGRVEFLPMYMYTGVAVIGLWPLAPFLSAWQAGATGVGLYLLMAFTSLYGLAVVYTAARSASRLSPARMAAAVTVCIVVIASMLYIWL